MKYSRLLAVAVLLSGIAAGSVGAQEPGVPPMERVDGAPLSLAEAIDAARENNPAYRRAANDLDVAAAGERQSVGAFLPSVNLSMGLNGRSSRTVTGEDDFGRPITLDTPREYEGSSSSQSLSVQLPLFEGGRFAGIAAARAGTRAAAAGVDAEIARLDAELTRSYYTAVRYDRQAGLEESMLESARERYEATRRLLAIAAIDPLDLLGAEIEVARQERAARGARGQAEKAILSLQELMAVSGTARYVLTDSLPALFDPSVLTADALVASALERNPTIARAASNAEAAEARLTAARGSRLPSVGLSMSYGRSMGQEGYGAIRELNPRNSSTSFGLNVSLPVFRQFQTAQQVAQARASALDAHEDERAERLQTEREIRSSLIDLEEAYGAATLADRAAGLARDRLEMAREKYELGTLSFAELRDVVDQAAAAEREALDARATFAAALVTLEERLGSRLPGR